jgi:hypothetical protein
VPSLTDYGFERGNDLFSLGAEVRDRLGIDVGDELHIDATLAFGQRRQAVLWIFEAVVITEGQPHRRKYGYHAEYEDIFLFRYDRDPEQHPEMPEHKHLPPDGRRVTSGRVTLREVVEELLDIVAEREGESDRPA